MLVAGLTNGDDNHVRLLCQLLDNPYVLLLGQDSGVLAGIGGNGIGNGQAVLGRGPAAHQGIRVKGAGAAHQNGLLGIGVQGQSAIVFQQGHGLSGSLEVHLLVFLIAHEGNGVVHVTIGILEHSHLELDLHNAGSRSGQNGLVNLTLLGVFLHQVNQADGFAADAIHAALGHANENGFFIGDFLAGHGSQRFLNGPNHAPVGLDNPGKAHFIPEQILQGGFGTDGGIFHIQCQRHGVVGHNGSHIHFQGCIVGLQVNLQGFLAGNNGRGVLALHLGACAGEVLHASHDGAGIQAIPAVLEGYHLGSNHLGHQVGIFTEGLHHAPPAGFGGDVRLRRQRHADTNRQMLVPGNLGKLGNQGFIPGSCQCQVVGGDGGTRDIAQTVDRIHGHQYRNTQPGSLGVLLNGVHGGGSCLHTVQLPDQQHTDAIFAAIVLQIGCNLAVCPGQVGGMLHLGNLFPYRHLAHQVSRARLGILPPVLINVQLAVAVEVDELIAIHLKDGFGMGVQCGLGVGFALGKGNAGEHTGGHGGCAQQGNAALPNILSQQGSSLLSRWLLSARLQSCLQNIPHHGQRRLQIPESGSASWWRHSRAAPCHG